MSGDRFVVKDSGKRQEFETGARRDVQAGKGRFDLIPTLPIRRLAVIYEKGVEKYGENNWQKGIPLGRFLDSAERHFNQLKAGEPTEDHAMQAAWNLFAYVWTLAEIEAGRLPRSLDTRPRPEPQYEDPQCASCRGAKHEQCPVCASGAARACCSWGALTPTMREAHWPERARRDDERAKIRNGSVERVAEIGRRWASMAQVAVGSSGLMTCDEHVALREEFDQLIERLK